MTNLNDLYLHNDLQPQAQTFERLKSQHEVRIGTYLKAIYEVLKRGEK